ncbi:small ribosomal subunit protein uS14m-like [Tubulanus polymorphus]|uniref:small ribosomal subunit protein uS14m-like n=1 Tax=Tubulanus polymorphus TaxID=672921 RepID=UPI003DA4DA3B
MAAPMAKICQYFGAFKSSFLRTSQTCITSDTLMNRVTSGATSSTAGAMLQPVFTRNTYGWVNWQMVKDVKKRGMVEKHSKTRMRLNAVRKNSILPPEIREIADLEIDAMPRDTNLHRCRNRCVLTSRRRGNLRKWRVSRIVWRHLADYNKLPGVLRACW